MRIIAGEYRGRAIQAPDGRGTRPTTDRVRESLMSAISSALDGFEGIHAYDVFAGSGALGFEVLSRGGDFVLFTDADSSACAVIRQNAAALQVEAPRYRVLRADVFHRPGLTGAPFRLVFLDPPYATPVAQVVSLLETLEEAGALASDVLITYEHAKKTDCSALFASLRLPLTLSQSKEYGDTVIEFLRKDPS